MDPHGELEQEEDYQKAISILKELEERTDHDDTLVQEQANLILLIETEVGRCIQALVARKEALIREVTEKLKAKRTTFETNFKQMQRSIDACKKLVDSGASMYHENIDYARKSWKLATQLKCETTTSGNVEVNFQSLMKDIENFGKVTVNFGELLTREARQSIETWLPNKRFTLLYKASRDGFQGQDFHKLCDKKGPTLTLIRSQPHNFVFGGYTPQFWEANNKFKVAPDGFIFTLTNPHNIPPTKYAVTKPAYSIHGNSIDGPCFGNGYDIGVVGGSNTTKGSSTNFPSGYEDTTGKGKDTFVGELYFTTNEVEVYSVV